MSEDLDWALFGPCLGVGGVWLEVVLRFWVLFPWGCNAGFRSFGGLLLRRPFGGCRAIQGLYWACIGVPYFGVRP